MLRSGEGVRLQIPSFVVRASCPCPPRDSPHQSHFSRSFCPQDLLMRPMSSKSLISWVVLGLHGLTRLEFDPRARFTLPGSPLGHFSSSFLLLLTFLQLDNFAKDKVSSLDRGADSTVSSLAFISLLLRIGKRLGRLQLVSLLLDGYLV